MTYLFSLQPPQHQKIPNAVFASVAHFQTVAKLLKFDTVIRQTHFAAFLAFHQSIVVNRNAH